MLATHAAARDRRLDVVQLAKSAGYDNYGCTNLLYGRLGRDIARELDRDDEKIWTRIIADDDRDPKSNLIRWRLFPELAQAVEALGWTDEAPPHDPIGDAEQAAGSLEGIPETVRQALVEARIGQGQFRKDLVLRWGGCAVTGCTVLEVLRASHLKPWRDSDNSERLDDFNGLLLIATLDALLDAGLITFSDSGELICSEALPEAHRALLGVQPGARLRNVEPRHHSYLEWHRHHVFKSGSQAMG